jgi:molybdopterin synthase catalytic subunit
VRVTVLYFAAARERAGLDRESLDVNDGATVLAVKALIAERHPALGAVMGHLRVAVDKAFATDGQQVRDGAEVALIPPVSGGAR